MADDAAGTMRERLRTDLRAAMQSRNTDETRVLRALLGAIDNGQAVPVDPDRKTSNTIVFGDRSIEVARRNLNAEDVRALLADEVNERLNAANVFNRLGQGERAALLHTEAKTVRRYCVD